MTAARPRPNPRPTELHQNAVRQRRARQRRRDGRMVFSIEIEAEAVIWALMASNRLTETEAQDRHLVETAISGLLSEWAAAWLR